MAGCGALKKDAPVGAGLNGAAPGKSARSVGDQQAALGVAATRVEERILASLGQLQAAPIRFEPATDVPQGGVLCALPALLGLGLLGYSATSFPWLPG